jgi:hypothetical protein
LDQSGQRDLPYHITDLGTGEITQYNPDDSIIFFDTILKVIPRRPKSISSGWILCDEYQVVSTPPPPASIMPCLGLYHNPNRIPHWKTYKGTPADNAQFGALIIYSGGVFRVHDWMFEFLLNDWLEGV